MSCGEILGILGNFRKFWRNFGEFLEILGDFATIYALPCIEKLSPKNTFVEKKLSCGETLAFYTEFEQFMEFY